jgi:exopolyphosphatase/guanosine-5'-triphosphate,3'-diphosphate pyrophosphatase
VIVGGLAVMLALFQELGIETMTAAQGAMREGILWDLLGRVHDRDMRDVTISQFQRRYHVDLKQARRVEALALRLAGSLSDQVDADALRCLVWAARMHEIGITIAHSGFHKHGAYILENADMPGFSRRDQARLAALVRASRGGLQKLALSRDDVNWPLILCLRLAVLFHASRSDVALADMRLDCHAGACELSLPADWLKANPLSQAVLEEELRDWRALSPAVGLMRVGT